MKIFKSFNGVVLFFGLLFMFGGFGYSIIQHHIEENEMADPKIYIDQNGKMIVDSQNQPIDCPKCPCGTPGSVGSTPGSVSGGSIYIPPDEPTCFVPVGGDPRNTLHATFLNGPLAGQSATYNYVGASSWSLTGSLCGVGALPLGITCNGSGWHLTGSLSGTITGSNSPFYKIGSYTWTGGGTCLAGSGTVVVTE